jgi:hypothetical protein
VITISSPQNAIQAALVSRLRADAALSGLLAKIKGVATPTPAVVDRVPEGQPYPYVRVGDHLSTPDNTHTTAGRRVTETVHVWTRERSMGPGQTIATRIGELLDHQVAAVDALLRPNGHKCVSIRQTFDQALDDPDPEIRHHVLRFIIETSQVS